MTNERPVSVSTIAWFYIAVGVISTALHLFTFKSQQPKFVDSSGIIVVGLVALVAGAYMLQGRNWARWLALAWIAFHVVLSVFHSIPELIVHSVLLAVIAYFLFRPNSRDFFTASRAAA